MEQKMKLVSLQRIAAGGAMLALLGVLSAPLAQAQTWPSRPITIVLPYAAGGPTDGPMRLIAQKMGEDLGQSVLIEIAAGANTMIAAEKVSKAAPDGYTLFAASTTTLSTNHQMYRTLRYKPQDFVLISNMLKLPYSLSVHTGLPVKTLPEFIAYAKSRPGQVFSGTTGAGSTADLLTEMLNSATGIKTVGVPYKGSAPALLDVIGGRVQYLIMGINSAIGPHRSGQARAIAVTSEQRLASMAEVPTFAELGYPGMTSSFWLGLVAPAGTPAAVVERVNASLNKALRNKELADRLTADGLIVDPGTPEQFAAVIKNDAEIWGRAIKATGIQFD
jgi:tripartite-type tricarboxylate transporter receptor subunit TctC